MNLKRISCFNDFADALIEAGFSTGGSNNEGVFSICSNYADNIHWHTDDPETDPWEWRMRVLRERDDIAYAKLFFRKSGYIAKEWYPYFLAARRKGDSFEDAYESGKLSIYAKRVYEVIRDNGRLPSHNIKRYCGFKKEDNSKFEKALIELQMKMFITMCGGERKISTQGEYGWTSTVFCTAESFFDEKTFAKAEKITPTEASEKITERILELNPKADIKKTGKFIFDHK